ncbi:MAG: N-acetylneuraminate synthase [Sphingorhabdus sp.]
MPGNAACFIIAEIGVNHNGDLAMAFELIDEAAASGANAVKFQTFEAAKLVRPEAEKAEYQQQQTGEGSQKDMLEALQLSEDDHVRLAQYCRDKGIEFMSTPFDLEAADFLKVIGTKRMKLPSGDIDNIPMLRRMAALDMPVIISTGMADMSEVAAAKRCVEEEWLRLGLMQDRADRLVVLHCTSNYPAEPETVNLSAMVTMARELACQIGYSDHTRGSEIAVAAVALGAVVIEKHITLDKDLPGPDHAASLNPAEFTEMVRQIRAVEAAYGDGVKTPCASEMPVRALVRRSITVARDLPAGSTVGPRDLIMLRPANGIPPTAIDEVVGRQTTRPLSAGTLLAWSDLT